jgi:hypothetical protein
VKIINAIMKTLYGEDTDMYSKAIDLYSTNSGQVITYQTPSSHSVALTRYPRRCTHRISLSTTRQRELNKLRLHLPSRSENSTEALNRISLRPLTSTSQSAVTCPSLMMRRCVLSIIYSSRKRVLSLTATKRVHARHWMS